MRVRGFTRKGLDMKITSAVALTGLAFACSPACAWDSFGHMEVAAIAWGKLTPAARAQTTELLKLNPEYASWISDAPAQERDQIAFVTAATWPDFIKHATGYHSDGPNNGDRPPPGPEASQNIGYKDHFMHKYWHFIDEMVHHCITRTPPTLRRRLPLSVQSCRARVLLPKIRI
jgi:hypothetical protein